MTTIIIPARYASSRFPGKPLVLLGGKSLIRRSWEAAQRVGGVERVVVATDDNRIRTHAEEFGAEVVMTPPSCANGTERVYAAGQAMGLPEDALIVNLQGDAPLTPPWLVEALIEAMKRFPDQMVATPALRCEEETWRHFREDRRAGRVGGTTVVFDREGRALYFSKEVLPFVPENYAGEAPVFHHVGLYAYRMRALADYTARPAGMLETLEGLEQLRFMENGIPVHVVQAQPRPGEVFWEVNNPEDVARVEGYLNAEVEA